MQAIKLDVKEYTAAGAAHTSLQIDGQDAGVLYLNKTELSSLVNVLRAGCRESGNIMFEHLEPQEDEFDYDVFAE
tara:strand:- start:29 stop:253 length:225 start_codon:yes stop_codon:yes gene_type:complete